MNYVFYDFETSGTDRYFDQPIQIAAQLVDEKFNVLDEINEKCKLKDGIVPNPAALLINKVDIDTLENGQSFFQMIDKVYKTFNKWSPAIFFGYNSIFFDEVVLRQSLYQSMYSPYLTNTNKNRRSDIYNIVLGLDKLKPGLIKRGFNPKTEKESYKLEHLATANNLEQETAHDALSDVVATRELAKLISECDLNFWNHCLDISEIKFCKEYVQNDDIFLIAPGYPSQKYTTASFLTVNPYRDKEVAFFDLKNNPSEYMELKTSQIISLLQGKNKIMKTLEINKSPIILNSDFLDSSKVFDNKEISIFRDHQKQLNNQEQFINRLNHALVEIQEDREINYPMPDFLETQIYASFVSADDTKMMEQFKDCKADDLRYNMSKNFSDPRLREIGYRIIYSENPDILPKEKLKERKQFLAQKVLSTDDGVKWCTIEKAKKDLEEIKTKDKFPEEKGFIKEIEEFILKEEVRYKAYLT